mgnify:FL=1
MGWWGDIKDTDPILNWEQEGGKGGDIFDEIFNINQKPERGGSDTSAQDDLQAQQLQLLIEQGKLEKELLPFVLENMGLRYNAQGVLERIPPVEAPPDELMTIYQDYLNQALEGQIPTSAGLEADIAENTAIMDENLSRRLGSKYLQSTPGLETAGKFMRATEGAREGERLGLIGQYTGLLNQRQAQLSDINYAKTGLLQGTGASDYALTDAYTRATQPYMFQNQMNYAGEMQNLANEQINTAANYQLGGMLGGMGAYYGYNKYNQPGPTQYQQNVKNYGQAGTNYLYGVKRR